MNEPEIPSDDLYDDSLLNRGDLRFNDSFRRTVLAQTSRVLRRRRIVRRAGWAAAFAGCYFAGIVTMQTIWHLGNRVSPIARTEPAHATPTVPPSGAEPTMEDVSGEPTVIVSNRAASRKRRPSAFEVLRAAGDRSLNEQGDLRAAISYYGQAVKRASRQELEISTPHDNWLLQSLKQDRLQEVCNDKRNG